MSDCTCYSFFCYEHGKMGAKKEVIMSDRRARVNGAPHGTISWEEHELAWQTYHRHHREQDAEEINRRGGFGIAEARTATRAHAYNMAAR